MAKTTDMTKGNPLKLIVNFTIPLFLGNIFQQLYNMADSAIVGQKLGVNALTAVGASASLCFLIFGFCIGLCAGFGIPVSQRFGARDFKTMRKYVYSSLMLSAIISVVMTVVTCIYTRQILQLINTPAKLMEDAARYLFIIFAGIPCTVLYNEAASMARALGDSKTPFIYLVVSAVLNVGLDFLFIFGFDMGVEGAAIATVIAQGVSGVLCLATLLRKNTNLHGAPGDRRYLKPDSKTIAVLLKTGVPMGLQASITAVGSIMLQTAINGLDLVHISAYTVALKLKQLFIPIFDSLGTAMATFVGQNYGAGKLDRIRQGIKKASLLGLGMYVVTAVIYVLLGRYLIMIFVKPEETAVIGAAYQYITIDVVLAFLLVMLFIFRYSVQGIGRSLTAMVAGFMEMGARLIMSLFVIPVTGWTAACFTDPLAWGSAMIYCAIVFLVILRRIHVEASK